ncbi:hypothetical protein E4U49_000425, partial [Claviceps purpurea]
MVSPEDALPGGPEAVAASPVLLLLNPIITWSDSRESWDNSRDVEIDLTNPFEWPSDTMDGWIDQHIRPHYKTIGHDTPYAIGARRDAKGALRKLPGWKYPELRDIAELFDRRK